MARIRTIKPEFPQSESMGRISRDARLLFIELWTIADDEGRLRGNSRMLASLLFPYDDDAIGLIDTWLDELSEEGCIVRYSVDGSSYLQICNWLIHQKIDKPSKSKIPAFDESYRILSNPLERSSEDLRIKDQGSKDLPLVDEPSTTGNVTPIKPSTPDCPHQAIVDLYHEILPTLTQVRVMTEARQKQLRARWRENPKHQNLDFWRGYFEHVSQSDFLMGRSQQANGRAWAADFDFLTTQSKFVNVIEGKYHHG